MSHRFELGRLVAAPAALIALEQAGTTALPLLARHAAGDWGDVCEQDRRANEEALVNGCRILSVYNVTDTLVIWIITDAAVDDGRRPGTCVLLPEDY